MAIRPRILSGIQPTADSVHIGNYLGALRHWVDMQATHDCFVFIADMHATTVEHDPQEVARRTRLTFAQLLALGIDPAVSTLFVQSQVPEHAQLQWVLSCLTGMGEAGRMTQFKDKSVKSGADRTTVGLFTYPILQAADILLYSPDGVPVGEDQRQHLELTRDLAIRFNGRFGPVLKVPEPLIVKGTAKILDLGNPTAKMSKSAPGGCLFLLEPPKAAEKKIKSAVTDSGSEVIYDPAGKPGVSNLMAILAGLRGEQVGAVQAEFQDKRYGDLKKECVVAFREFAAPVSQRVGELMADPAELDALMGQGALRAREVATQTLAAVYRVFGYAPAAAVEAGQP